MDSIRSKFFFLEGSGEQIQISYNKMGEYVCPQGLWGFGHNQYENNNEALMSKWVRRIYNFNVGYPCIDLLRAKYPSKYTFCEEQGRSRFSILERGSKDQAEI